MADFPTDLTNAVDDTTDVQAKHVNNLEAKVGVDSSAVATSIDYFLKHASGDYRTHRHDGGTDDGSANLDALKEVVVTVADTENKVGVTVTQNDTTNNPNAANITNTGTGRGLFIDQDGVGLSLDIDSESTGQTVGIDGQMTADDGMVTITNNAENSNATSKVVEIINEHASTAGRTLEVRNDGTGNGVFVDQNGNGDAINIDTEATTQRAFNIEADAMTVGAAIRAYTDSASFANTTTGFVSARVDNSSATGNVLSTWNDGTGASLKIDQNGNGKGIFIDTEATTALALDIDGQTTSGHMCDITNAGTHITSGAVLHVKQDHASTTRPCIQVANDGSGQTINDANTGANLSNAGNWTNASDAARKKDVEDIEYGLETIMTLRPVSYTWKKNDQRDIGLIAQEVEKVVPEVVYGDDGSKSLSYGQLVAVCIKAIQQLKEEVDELRK